MRDARQSIANCKSELPRSVVETPKSMMSVLGPVEESVDHVVRDHLLLPLAEQLTATVNDWNTKTKSKAVFTDTDISVVFLYVRAWSPRCSHRSLLPSAR